MHDQVNALVIDGVLVADDNGNLDLNADDDNFERMVTDKIQTSKLFESLNNRKEISFEDYQDLHKSKNIPPLSNHSVRFSHTDKTVNSKGYRRYKI